MKVKKIQGYQNAARYTIIAYGEEAIKQAPKNEEIIKECLEKFYRECRAAGITTKEPKQ